MADRAEEETWDTRAARNGSTVLAGDLSACARNARSPPVSPHLERLLHIATIVVGLLIEKISRTNIE
jgi:hypothetical protein